MDYRSVFTKGGLTEAKLFGLTMWVKLVDGFLGVIAGVAVYFTTTDKFIALVYRVFQHELTEDPTDFLFNKIFAFLHGLSFSTQTFIALYLFVNGVLKIYLISQVLRDKLWAYPVTAGVLSLMVVYEIYRFFHTHSLFLLCIVVVDVLIVYMLSRHYQKLYQKRS